MPLNPHAPARAALLPVPDTLKALGDLARWYRSRFDLPVVAVTGSVGKTSTKEMAAAILGERGPTVATQANLNNEIGLPMTLFELESRHVAAVVEMAMRGAGQIAYLAQIARPQIGVVTNIGTSHLELLGSREAIARAKGELLEALPADGAAILPAADPFLPLLRSLSWAPVVTFGFAGEGKPDVVVAELSVAATESRFVVEAFGERIPVRLPVPGRHNALNAAAAAAAAWQAGSRAPEITAGLESIRLPGMRMRIVQTPSGATLLDDAYNASPQSMAAALEHLHCLPGRRRVAVLGDMLELGSESEAGHREVGQHAATVDLLIAVGERARGIAAGAEDAGLPPERARWCADADAALAAVRAELRPGDAVLVKASRGMRLETVAQGVENAEPH
ncbi:MAG: UDP-N-acetylmuramoyl-tripeptide--D-alanyl-D-alanine ligase [Armatimonadetes bacterium]|nr:UDP-N-acetylmuramoyl-tripeptide--D-alanyl-D-alanine ligase [Armatimonadota bacterium]